MRIRASAHSTACKRKRQGCSPVEAARRAIRSGIDMHLDVGASQFLTKQFQVGVVAYAYEQLTADQGCAPQLCPFKSRALGIGPQIGYVFPVGGMQGYVNVKAYKEFENDNRPDGWNASVTFVLSPAPPAAKPSPPMITKALPPS